MLFWSENFTIMEIEVLVETMTISQIYWQTVQQWCSCDSQYVFTSYSGRNHDKFLVASLRVLKYWTYGNDRSLLISFSCQFSQRWASSYVGLYTAIWLALNFWNDYFYLLYKLMMIDGVPFSQADIIQRWNFRFVIILIMR